MFGKGANWLEHGVNTREKAIYPPCEQLILNAEHVAKVVQRKADLGNATTDALGLLTFDKIKKQWRKSQYALDDYEGAHSARTTPMLCVPGQLPNELAKLFKPVEGLIYKKAATLRELLLPG